MVDAVRLKLSVRVVLRKLDLVLVGVEKLIEHVCVVIRLVYLRV